ncbi:MAG: hypothetical protein ACR2JC_01350 [Chloroflexota bacterium]
MVDGSVGFCHPVGLAALLWELKARGMPTVAYNGCALEVLGRKREPAVRQALHLIDLLVKGRFVAPRAAGAVE